MALRKIFSILFIAIFLLQTHSQLWVLTSFYINRNYIAQELCINRFEKVAVCKGSCFLEKKLREDNQKQEKIPDLKTKDVTLFCNNINNWILIPDISLSTIRHPLFNKELHPQFFYSAVFHPPAGAVLLSS